MTDRQTHHKRISSIYDPRVSSCDSDIFWSAEVPALQCNTWMHSITYLAWIDWQFI